jgi:hypothetical protein
VRLARVVKLHRMVRRRFEFINEGVGWRSLDYYYLQLYVENY